MLAAAIQVTLVAALLLHRAEGDCLLKAVLLVYALRRGVAQSGSVHAWGACGRGFKSRRPDHLKC